jgi:hypothetical protein
MDVDDMIKQARLPAVLLIFGAALATPRLAAAAELNYECSVPPLEVRFAIAGGHYNGAVNCGNLFLQTDIPTPPLVRWKQAKAGRLYTLMMLDFDGNANGSWPDQVPMGENSPVRHWIVGTFPVSFFAAAIAKPRAHWAPRSSAFCNRIALRTSPSFRTDMAYICSSRRKRSSSRRCLTRSRILLTQRFSKDIA